MAGIGSKIAKHKHKKFIKKQLTSKNDTEKLRLLLTCAISGQFDALNDILNFNDSQKATLKSSWINWICNTTENVKNGEFNTSYYKYYKEMSYKMITHCLLDTLFVVINEDDIKQQWEQRTIVSANGTTRVNGWDDFKFANYRCSLKEELIMKLPQQQQQEKNIFSDIYKRYIKNDKILKKNPSCNIITDDITIENLQYGINVYQRLIDKYPILQFVTSFCRELPHMYASSLLDQIEMIPIWKSASQVKAGEGYVVTDQVLNIIRNIYDRFATHKDERKKNHNDENNENDLNDLNDDGELIMTNTDFQNCIFACGIGGRSANDEFVAQIIDYHCPTDNINSDNSNVFDIKKNRYFTRDGFEAFYRTACHERVQHVYHDIIFNGLGEKLCQKKENLSFMKIGDNINGYKKESDKIKTKKYLMKCQFIDSLKKKFVSRELILIKYMIKQANMVDIFSKMNHDVDSVILKFLHPLNINEKDYHLSILDDKIRNYWKYTFGLEYFIIGDFINYPFNLLCQPYFRNLFKQYAKKSHNNDYLINNKVYAIYQDAKDVFINIVQFRKILASL